MIHQPSALRDPTDEERAVCEAYREAHKDDAIGQVADTLLYEDEKVKIWQMTLEPGQASDLHHHACDYYLCISSGDKIAGVMREEDGGAIFVSDLPERGNTVPVDKGRTEWALNIGSVAYREVLIELKGS